ncbi:ATP synthase subunit b [Buchnera aphidicola (Periphyllus testudinaceus)]|uniref:F0F1 ATP synthase subunit B n=1 Tax=Buchnera aphidicola TaxID=9 RepID=UPI0034638E9E
MNINATIFGQFISFVFFVLFCMKFIWPPIIKVIKKRQKKIYNSMLLVKHAKKKLIKINKKISQNIKNSKLKSINFIKKAHEEKNRIIKKSIQKALFEKNKIIKNAHLELLIKFNKEKSKLKKKSVFLIIEIVKKILNKELSQDYSNKMIDKFKVDFKGFKL